jgi:hypothetical protein
MIRGLFLCESSRQLYPGSTAIDDSRCSTIGSTTLPRGIAEGLRAFVNDQT